MVPRMSTIIIKLSQEADLHRVHDLLADFQGCESITDYWEEMRSGMMGRHSNHESVETIEQYLARERVESGERILFTLFLSNGRTLKCRFSSSYMQCYVRDGSSAVLQTDSVFNIFVDLIREEFGIQEIIAHDGELTCEQSTERQLLREAGELVMPFLYLGNGQPQGGEPALLENGMEILRKLESSSREAVWLLGKCYEAKHDWNRSYETFKKLIDSDSGDERVLHEFIMAALRSKHSETALTVARRAVLSHPHDLQLAFDLALSLSTTGRFSEALQVVNTRNWSDELIPRVQELRKHLTDSNS